MFDPFAIKYGAEDVTRSITSVVIKSLSLHMQNADSTRNNQMSSVLTKPGTWVRMTFRKNVKGT